MPFKITRVILCEKNDTSFRWSKKSTNHWNQSCLPPIDKKKHQEEPNAAFRIGCYNFSCSLQMWFNSFAEAIKTLTLWGHSKRTKMGVIKRVKKEIVAMNHRRCKKDHKRWLKLPKKINIGKWQGALCCRCVKTRYRIVLLYCSIFLKNNNQPDHLL